MQPFLGIFYLFINLKGIRQWITGIAEYSVDVASNLYSFVTMPHGDI